MDENLYDEFGNYIGPDIPEIEESVSEEEEEKEIHNNEEEPEQMIVLCFNLD